MQRKNFEKTILTKNPITKKYTDINRSNINENGVVEQELAKLKDGWKPSILQRVYDKFIGEISKIAEENLLPVDDDLGDIVPLSTTRNFGDIPASDDYDRKVHSYQRKYGDLVSDTTRRFDYKACLRRMKESSSSDLKFSASYEEQCLRTRLFMYYDVQPEVIDENVDEIAMMILAKFPPKYPEQFAGKKAIHADANRNCLWNSLSTALIGNSSLATELRVRVAIELINYSTDYEYIENLATGFFSDSIETTMELCVSDGCFCGPYAIAGAATVLGRTIVS